MTMRNVVPLEEEIIKTSKKVSDLEWEGDYQTAKLAQYHLEYLQKLRDEGHVWYPLF